MRSTPSTQLAAAVAVVEGLPPAEPGLGSAVAEEVALLGRLGERTEVALLERLAVLDASGACAGGGFASTEAWLVATLGFTRARANGEVWFARALHCDRERPLDRTAAQLREQSLTVEQARVIARSVSDLPTTVTAEAETLLLEAARRLAPAQLSVVGRRLRRVLVDDVAVRAEIARGERYLRLTPALFGMWAIDGLVDAETGAALQAGFDALLATPAPAATQPTLDPVTTDTLTDGDAAAVSEPARPTATQRRADALGEIVRGWLAAGGAPIAGGSRPQLVVTIDLATLTGADPAGLAHVRPDSRTGAGTEIGPDTARRLGCDGGLAILIGHGDQPSTTDPDPDPATGAGQGAGQGAGIVSGSGPRIDTDLLRRMLAGIAPALGGLAFDPLDLGRTARLVSPAQRLALNARDRGCIAPGCTTAPERCEAHHLIFWADGGPTDLDNLALVCHWHHHLVHEQAWTLRRDPRTGRVTLTPPEPTPRQ